MKNHEPLHKRNILIVSENICCGMNMYDFDLRVFSLNEFLIDQMVAINKDD